ncbi:hypothetical protein UB32_16015 [Mesobacillus subterraneus]|uniref:Uncharacterized protein n=1 Tax=Mesobacillus subterraneus TaxID=285983 RepID=A0A0D6Z6T8_9BACI|nr:hypothetical protein UB32_16015 [Mesobacillus subterraneus]
MLGGDHEDYITLVPSPFTNKQTEVKIQSLSTRFKDRTRSVNPIVQTMSDLVHNAPGNYLFFFPSLPIP